MKTWRSVEARTAIERKPLIEVDGIAELQMSLRNMAFTLGMLHRDPTPLDAKNLTGTIFKLHCQIMRISEAIDGLTTEADPG